LSQLESKQIEVRVESSRIELRVE